MTIGCRVFLFLSILSIIIIIIALVFRKELFPPSSTGTWGIIRDGDCIVPEDSCEQEGIRARVQDCIPSKEGSGCLLEDGTLTFSTRLKLEPCYLPCKSSVWSKVDGQCTNGIVRTTYTCIAKDPTGQNYCSLNLIQPSVFNGTIVPPCYPTTTSTQPQVPTLFPIGYSCYTDNNCPSISM